MPDPFAARLGRRADVQAAVELLGERLAPRDAASVLIAAHRRRSAALGVAELVRRWREDRFVRPSAVPPALLRELDRLAATLVPAGFEEVELSPLAPLGSSSVLGGVDQARVVSTIRTTEILADPAPALALEAARRTRRSDPGADVRLWTSHRVVRADPPPSASHSASFRLVALCSSGRARTGFEFELDALRGHLAFHLDLLREAATCGIRVGPPEATVVLLADGPPPALVEERVLAGLRRRLPGASLDVQRAPAGGGSYYSCARLVVRAAPEGGRSLALVDGGFTDWSTRLLHDRRRRLLTSGIGTELLCAAAAAGRADAADDPDR